MPLEGEVQHLLAMCNWHNLWLCETVKALLALYSKEVDYDCIKARVVLIVSLLLFC